MRCPTSCAPKRASARLARLHRLWKKLSRRWEAGQLPWCSQFGQDAQPGSGWVGREEVKQLFHYFQQQKLRENENEVRSMVAEKSERINGDTNLTLPYLTNWNTASSYSTSGRRMYTMSSSLDEFVSMVMSGDISQMLKWPDFWLPSSCRMYRYNLTSIHQYGVVFTSVLYPIVNIVLLKRENMNG